MVRAKYVKSQLMWSSDGVDWPGFGSGGHNVLTKPGSMSFTYDQVTPAMMLEIDNNIGSPLKPSIGADACLIEFSGQIESITTINPPSGGGSSVRVAMFGLPFNGDLVEDVLLATHPLEDSAQAISQITGWQVSGVTVPTFLEAYYPPYFGIIPRNSFALDFMQGWPFYNGAVTAGDRWHWVWPIGQIGGDSASISMYRKLFMVLKSVNPALVAGSPSAMNISGRMYAHLYEYRETR